jgi:hypothetical protein
MKAMRSLETQCCCCDTTVRMRTAMWHVWGGQTCAVSCPFNNCVGYGIDIPHNFAVLALYMAMQVWPKKDFARTDENLGIEYESDEIFGDTVLLLRYNCPDGPHPDSCIAATALCLQRSHRFHIRFQGFRPSEQSLHRHVKSKHSKVMWYVDTIPYAIIERATDCTVRTVTYAIPPW